MAWTSRAGGEGGLREKESVRGAACSRERPRADGHGWARHYPWGWVCRRGTRSSAAVADAGRARGRRSAEAEGLPGGRHAHASLSHDHGTAAEGAGSSGASGWAETISSGWAEMSERMGRESEASSGASGWARSDDFKSTCGLSVEEPTSRREVGSRPPV